MTLSTMTLGTVTLSSLIHIMVAFSVTALKITKKVTLR